MWDAKVQSMREYTAFFFFFFFDCIVYVGSYFPDQGSCAPYGKSAEVLSTKSPEESLF